MNMKEVAASKKGGKKTIAEATSGLFACNDCFNDLSEELRGGKGARPADWVESDTPTEICEICGDNAFRI